MKKISKLATHAVCLVLFASLAACGGSSTTEEMQSDIVMETENSAEIIDPGSILSTLEFDAAESQASYQCLLSAATSTATAEGMQAYPAWWNDDPTLIRGSFQTWCKTTGEGALVEEDLVRCEEARILGMQAPGTHALSVNTQHFSARGPVSTIGHSSKQIPEAGTEGWAFSFTKSFGASASGQQNLSIEFQRFDGTQLVEEKGRLIHPYFYRDDAVGLMEFVNTDTSVNAYLADYSASASQFKSTVDAYLSAVMVQLDNAIRSKADLSEEEVTSALARVNAEINQSREFFNQHGDELHPLLLTRETYVDCEGQ